MASAFLVVLPAKGGMNLSDGCDAAIVWAEDSTMAKDLAVAMAKDDVPAAGWANATVTALVVGTELEGWTFSVVATDNNSPYTVISASVTGTNGQNIDNIGTALAAALVTAGIAGAAYNTSSNLLTIAETTDGMGDWDIRAYAYPPTSVTSTSLVGAEDGGSSGKSVSGIFGAITAAGASGIARTSTLVAALPAMYGMARMKR